MKPKRTCFPGAALLLAALCGAAGQTPEKSSDVVPVKYSGLKEEVLKQRGKVLVLDLWASD